MITGAHCIVHSKASEADRAFLRDVLALGHVDVGDGWLIFGLPPSEVAIHPSEEREGHELYLMCEDVEVFVREMQARDIACTAVSDMGWGLLTQITLPGGGKLGVYQPRHARPEAVAVTQKAVSKADKKAAKKAAKDAAKDAVKAAAKEQKKADKKAAKLATKLATKAAKEAERAVKAAAKQAKKAAKQPPVASA